MAAQIWYQSLDHWGKKIPVSHIKVWEVLPCILTTDVRKDDIKTKIYEAFCTLRKCGINGKYY